MRFFCRCPTVPRLAPAQAVGSVHGKGRGEDELRPLLACGTMQELRGIPKETAVLPIKEITSGHYDLQPRRFRARA